MYIYVGGMTSIRTTIDTKAASWKAGLKWPENDPESLRNLTLGEMLVDAMSPLLRMRH